MKRILNRYLLSIGIVLLSIVVGNAQRNVAFQADIADPIYHLFSSQEYPTLALSNSHLYKVFGNTIISIELSETLNLSGSEPAELISAYNQIWISNASSGATVIDFSNHVLATVSQVLSNRSIGQIIYNQEKLVYILSKDSICSYSMTTQLESCQYIEGLISAGIAIDQDSVLFADFLTGVISINTDKDSQVLNIKGITAFAEKDESLYMLANGQITRRLPDGSIVKLGNIPDKHKSASKMFVDDALHVWVQSTDLYFYDQFAMRLHPIAFENTKDLKVFDAISVDDYVNIATSNGLFHYKKTVDELVHKKDSKEIPRIYGSHQEAYLIDDGDLYTTINGKQFKKLSVNTKLKYPIPGNKAWWVNLGGKLVKVGNKSIPPIEAPVSQINTIFEVSDTQLLIGGEGILHSYVLNDPTQNKIMSDITVINIVNYNDGIYVITQQAVYRLEGEHLIAIDGLTGEYLALAPVVQEANRLFLFTKDNIEIVNQDTVEQVISAMHDLNIKEIIDVELVNEKLYILSPQQLTAILIGDLVHGSFHISEKYPVTLSNKANLAFVAGKLFIESEDHISFINPVSFLDQKIEVRSEPKFTLEQDGNQLYVYDQSGSLLPNLIRYKAANGDWQIVNDNTIELKKLTGSRKEVVLQKMNAYGEWIPKKPEPVFVSSSVRPTMKMLFGIAVLILCLLLLILLFRKKK